MADLAKAAICYAECMDEYANCRARQVGGAIGCAIGLIFDPVYGCVEGSAIGSGGGTICQTYYLVVEISYDGGVTWYEIARIPEIVCS